MWNLYFTFGIFFGILVMLITIYLTFDFLYKKFTIEEYKETRGAMLVIPGVTIPLVEGLIAIFLAVVFHEFSHGVASLIENVRIRSVGAIFFLSIPIGAFVEPEEEDLMKKSLYSKLKIYAAGSLSNIILGIFAFLLLVQPFYFDGVKVLNVVENSPSFKILEKGDIIYEINGEKVKTTGDLLRILEKYNPGDIILIKTNRGEFKVKLGEKDNRVYLGILMTNNYKNDLYKFLHNLMFWIFLLNVGIGMINLLPISFGVAATDGYHMIRDILKARLEDFGDIISKIIGTTFFIVLMMMLLL